MSQVDYIMCRGESRKECKNCTVILGESVTNQHRPVVGRLEMKVKKQHKAVVKETKTKWWSLKKAEHREKFVEKIVKKKDEMMAGDWEKFAGENASCGRAGTENNIRKEKGGQGGLVVGCWSTGSSAWEEGDQERDGQEQQ